MKKVFFYSRKKFLVFALLVLFVDVFGICSANTFLSKDKNELPAGGSWGGDDNENRSIYIPISIYQYSDNLTIQDNNPVNTITVRITCNDSGAVVFENVYPQGQTGLIVIPLSGWSAGSYTIELFGRENNGYLVGTFQILP